MAFQDLFPEWGRPKQLATFFGRELLGAAVKAVRSVRIGLVASLL